MTGHGIAVEDIERLPGSTRLERHAIPGSQVLRVRAIPDPTLMSTVNWVVIEPFSNQCEVRKITQADNREISFASGLSYSHPPNSPVIYLQDPTITVAYFGAKGNGVTDDTTSINRALAQVSNGIKKIVFSQGEYLVSAQINLVSDIVFWGSNQGAKIKAKNGAGFVLLNVQGKDNVLIGELELDGNQANIVGNSTGIQLHSSTNVTVRNCLVHDFTNVGILTTSAASYIRIEGNRVIANGKAGSSSKKNIFVNGSPGPVWLIDNYVADNLVGDGIMVSTANVQDMHGVVIKGNRVSNNNTIGIYVAGDGVNYIYDVVVTGNVSSGNRDNILMTYCVDGVCNGNSASNNKEDSGGLNGDGVVLHNCKRIACTGNACKGNRARGILLQDSNYCTVSGNVCYANNQAGLANVGGIDLYNASKYNTVVGNDCCDAAVPATQVYGVAENTGTDSPDSNLIMDNIVLGNLTAGVKRVGANTIIRNNLGFKTENAGNAVMGIGATTLVANHGLAVTPNNYHFTVMFASDPGVAENIWVNNITATQFTINISAALGVAKTMLWQVKVL